MKNKHTLMSILAICMIACGTSLNAQIFYSTGGVTAQNAQNVGEPGNGNGQVWTKNAPSTPDRKTQVIGDLRTAGVPDNIILNNRFLGNGAFSVQISDMWAVKQTAKNVRKVTSRSATPSGGIYIWNTQRLNEERAKIASNQTHTFIFTGWTNVDKPIFVGSNTTIWIDGTLNYNGQDMPRTAMGAAFTPRPSKYDGVFNIRPGGNFQDEGTQAGRNHNKNVQNGWNNSSDRKSNINIFGTRKGQILVGGGNYTDPDGQKLPKVNGITLMRASKIRIEGVTIKNSFQALFVSSLTHSINLTNNFFDNTLYRAMHIKGAWSPSGYGLIKNNLLTNSKFDGIDMDSFAQGFNITENVVIGARDRLMYWTEIDAKNNTFNNNVGIVLDAATEGNPFGNAGKGTFQENGTEASRIGTAGFSGNSGNKWLNNHAFYAEREFDGFVMRKERYIQFSTITFTNNYVWTLKRDIRKHNPKRSPANDVYYLFGSNNSGGGLPGSAATGLSGAYHIKKSSSKHYIYGTRPWTPTQSPLTLSSVTSTSNNTKWVFTSLGGDLYDIKNVATGGRMELFNGNVARGSEVKSTTWNGTADHIQWRVRALGNNEYMIVNKKGSAFALDIWSSNSNVVHLWDISTGNANQIFRLEAASGARLGDKETSFESASLDIYPNPTQGETTFNFDLEEEGKVSLKVYDMNGREVASLVDEVKAAGNHQLTWKPQDAAEHIYLVKLKTPSFSKVSKLLVAN